MKWYLMAGALASMASVSSAQVRCTKWGNVTQCDDTRVRATQGVDAEPDSADKCTEKEIDEGLVRLARAADGRADGRRSEVSPHPAAGTRIEHHRLGMKAGPRQNERTVLNAAWQTNRRRCHRRRLQLPAANVNGGTGGIGDDHDLLMTPVVHSRTARCENDYRHEGPKVHVNGSFHSIDELGGDPLSSYPTKGGP